MTTLALLNEVTNSFELFASSDEVVSSFECFLSEQLDSAYNLYCVNRFCALTMKAVAS